MIRLLIFELMAFFIPFLAYGFYSLVVKTKEENENFWQQAPLFNLSMAGLLLVGSGILFYGFYWA